MARSDARMRGGVLEPMNPEACEVVPRTLYPTEFFHALRAVAVIDWSGRLVDVNPVFEPEVGVPRHELVGHDIGSVWSIDVFAPELGLEERMRADGMVSVDVTASEQCPAAPPATLLFLPIFDGDRRIGCSVSVVTEAEKHRKRRKALDVEGFQLSFDQLAVGMLITGVDGFVIQCNPAMARLFGRSHVEIAESDVVSMIHPEHRTAAIEKGLRIITGEVDGYSHEVRLLDGKGEAVWVHETTTCVRDTDGNPLHFMSQFIDIRDRKRIEDERNRALEALRESEAKIKFLVDGTPVPLIEIDGELVIRTANAALASLIGREPIGLSITEVIHPEDMEKLQEWAANVDSDVDWIVEIRVMRRDGTLRTVRSHGRIHLDESGAFRSATATWNDVTETKHAEDQLRQQASTDPLTGLSNRTTFLERLTDALDRAEDPRSIALLFVDLDHFKPVNDRWGHDAGDELLIEVARRLKGCTREGDTIARFGGDEFVILAPSVNSLHVAMAIGERVVEHLAEPFALRVGEATISASVGLALGGPGSQPRALVRDADLAAYQAKDGGRSRLVVSS